MEHTTHKVIRPHLQTPSVGPRETTGFGRLPDDLLLEQVRRLAMCAAVGAGLWSYGFVMDVLVVPLTVARVAPAATVMVEIIGIVVSIAMFLYVRYASHHSPIKADVGLGYVVLNAVGVALLNTWARTPTVESLQHLSWNTVVILVAAMIMPTSPRKMLVTMLAAASMDPLGVWLAHLRGVDVPSVVNTFVLFMPNYACAVVATLPSHVLQRIGRRLRHAQEMGSYHLVERLGRGGMGEVWRGRHHLLARNAAIKLVRPELLGASTDADSRSMLRRFEREAQATAALSSPHTIRVFDFGVTADQTFYYVMELLTGRDLETLVREFGPIPANRAMFLLEQVCHSLADAHARGMVHRDVTPANIYACRMGLDYDFVKVLDFGLVTFRGNGSMERTLLTGGHTTTGTPAYMAPEVILDGEVDQRADVYALGCVAYFLLTGGLVFEADTAMKMFVQHLQSVPVPPSQRTEMPIPRDVDDLVMACLEKDPRRRPQDAQQVLRMLRHLTAGTPWDSDMAKSWWDTHLPDLAGPLTVAEPASGEAITV